MRGRRCVSVASGSPVMPALRITVNLKQANVQLISKRDVEVIKAVVSNTSEHPPPKSQSGQLLFQLTDICKSICPAK
jgi:hypothetical protein